MDIGLNAYVYYARAILCHIMSYAYILCHMHTYYLIEIRANKMFNEQYQID